jgi:glycosyltransferase involved in cell wall biosynthesis
VVSLLPEELIGRGHEVTLFASGDLRGAVATLFPITWPEPFRLVMIESMVTGTPVIAMNLGSTSEVIVHGKTGFLCRSVKDCLSAIDRVPELNRYACREHVLRNFTIKQMTDGYEGVYSKLASRTTQDLISCRHECP